MERIDEINESFSKLHMYFKSDDFIMFSFPKFAFIEQILLRTFYSKSHLIH